jgi:hypothetical protein
VPEDLGGEPGVPRLLQQGAEGVPQDVRREALHAEAAGELVADVPRAVVGEPVVALSPAPGRPVEADDEGGEGSLRAGR